MTGFPVVSNEAGDGLRFDVDHPYKGAEEAAMDFWVGYQRQLTDNVTWRIQFNVRNLLASDELIPVTVQPNGDAAAYRIPEPRTWTLSNSLSF